MDCLSSERQRVWAVLILKSLVRDLPMAVAKLVITSISAMKKPQFLSLKVVLSYCNIKDKEVI